MLKNILFSFITKGSVALINFLILLVSARYLGVSSRGEISIVILNIAMVQLLAEIYSGYSLVYFIPHFNQKKILLYGLVFILLFSSIGNLVLFAFNRQVSGAVFETCLLSVLVLLHTFFCVLILGRKNVRLFSLLSLLQPFLLMVFLVIAVRGLHVYTLEAYTGSLMASFALAICFSAWYALRGLNTNQQPAAYSVAQILSKGFLYQSSVFLFVFMNRYSFYLLQERAEVGLYSTACTFCESLLLLANGIAPVLLSRVAGGQKQGAAECLSLVKATLLICVVGLGILLLLPEDFFIFFLGKGFAGIRQVMLLYAPVVLLQSVAIIIGSYYTGRGFPGIVLRAYLVGTICTLVLAPLLVKQLGISGAALAANTAFLLVAFVIGFVFVNREKISFAQIFSLRQGWLQLRQLLLAR